MLPAEVAHKRKKRKRSDEAAAWGSEPSLGDTSRYRDNDFFISPTHTGRQADAAYAVHDRSGGANAALDGAVLDLLADDQVLCPDHCPA